MSISDNFCMSKHFVVPCWFDKNSLDTRSIQNGEGKEERQNGGQLNWQLCSRTLGKEVWTNERVSAREVAANARSRRLDVLQREIGGRRGGDLSLLQEMRRWRRREDSNRNSSSRKGGLGSPDSRYLITDIASLPYASRPGFAPCPEQMFAPHYRGQIVVQTGRLPVCPWVCSGAKNTYTTHTVRTTNEDKRRQTGPRSARSPYSLLQLGYLG